jgi:SMODS-associating 2TM, beta-strand rich effector domain
MMETIKKEVLIYLSLGLMLLIWVGVLRATGTPLSINWEAITKLPDVVTVFVVISFVFTKWLWRISWFRGWLVRFPDLQGTWEGELQSTWENPETRERPAAIKMFLVVRQTFSTISCTMFTKESVSYSRAAQLAKDEETEAISLSFNYTNRSKATIREKSPIHDGAAHLRIVTVPSRMLEGEYWTGRCTTGDMKLRFHSWELLEAFPEDMSD